MRTIFFGTPPVAVGAFEALIAADDVDVLAAVTNPDRARGRGGRPQPSAVKQAARAAGVPVLQPERPGTAVEDLRRLGPDVCAVVAYGALLPRAVLDVAPLGFVNVHFSLLPRWRGAAPVQHAIRAGDDTTGITVFRLDEGMDTGPIITQRTVEIGDDETAGELLDRLAVLGGPALVDALRRLRDGVAPTRQPDAGVSYAPKIRSEDVAIEWWSPVDDVVRLVRSANPVPGAHTTFRGRRLKVHRAQRVDGDRPGAQLASSDPAQIVGIGEAGPLVACANGAIELTEVQPEGKQRMTGTAFVNGYQPRTGEALTSS